MRLAISLALDLWSQPLLDRGKGIGILEVFSGTAHAFGDNDIRHPDPRAKMRVEAMAEQCHLGRERADTSRHCGQKAYTPPAAPVPRPTWYKNPRSRQLLCSAPGKRFWARASRPFTAPGSDHGVLGRGLQESSKQAQTAAVEEAAHPPAGCHGGVLTQSKNHQFGLGIVCVGRRFRLVHVLGGDGLMRGVRAFVCHVTEDIAGTMGG